MVYYMLDGAMRRLQGLPRSRFNMVDSLTRRIDVTVSDREMVSKLYRPYLGACSALNIYYEGLLAYRQRNNKVVLTDSTHT